MHETESLARQVVARARANRWSLVTAESCTGGALGSLISRMPGAGDVYFGGFVCYAKACKSSILGVSPSLISATTAVSEPVAKAMAQGAIARTGCHLAMAITGVIGPEEDEDGNPVGRLHIAVALSDGNVGHIACALEDEGQSKICETAMARALALALDFLPAPQS